MEQLWQKLFSTKEMDVLFSGGSFLSYMVKFEETLAKVQAELNIISQEDADVIEAVCRETNWDFDKIQNDTLLAGNPAIPFVKELIEKVKKKSVKATRSVHYGATSQDVIDTALMQQLKTGLAILHRDILALQSALITLANNNLQTVMMGRTLLQQAKPITLAHKAATWLDALNYSKNKIEELQKKTLAIQFGGAAGTLSSFGSKKENILLELGKKLDLNVPAITWHAERYRLADVSGSLAILCGGLGKMANDLLLLMQSEIAEVNEGEAKDKGGSSAMPHKRNPVSTVYIIAIANKTPGLHSSLLSGLIQEHERPAGNWHAEWDILPDMMKLSSASLKHSIDLISHLQVNKERMLENVALTKGLVFAEEVAAFLMQKMDRLSAQELVKRLCKEASDKKIHLEEVLLKEELFTKEQLEKIFSLKLIPENSYLFINEVLKQAK